MDGACHGQGERREIVKGEPQAFGARDLSSYGLFSYKMCYMLLKTQKSWAFEVKGFLSGLGKEI